MMDEFKMYTLLEMIYVNHFKNMGVLGESLFPLDWYDIKNYQIKMEVLKESLNNEVLIVDTACYRRIKRSNLILRRESEGEYSEKNS